ncbi:hypothetical protein Anas_09742 [Armadillidium nasatum]|uniref:Uncharacterized protein n=1 Tax=Armadillidium nasatum TaxID=96803 RepID=A0A5N5T655_9CRUS|nr:hypothetical protein Anas_09742 [Armadillidium nasatum]
MDIGCEVEIKEGIWNSKYLKEEIIEDEFEQDSSLEENRKGNELRGLYEDGNIFRNTGPEELRSGLDYFIFSSKNYHVHQYSSILKDEVESLEGRQKKIKDSNEIEMFDVVGGGGASGIKYF